MKYSYHTILASILILVFTLPENLAAQRETDAETPAVSAKFHTPKTGTRIWTGSAGLFRETRYIIDSQDELEANVQTYLDLEFSRLRFMNPVISLGMRGMGKLYMEGTLGNVALGTIGIGPLLRVYPFAKSMNSHWQIYTQGSFLAGYDLALGDAIGANRSEGLRYRSGLRLGVTHRFSNAFGVFMETGPDWEADETFRFDSRAWQFEVGIQLFRF